MKFNIFGKKFDIPPVDKKTGLTAAGMFAAGMAAGMSDNKLPDIPKGPLEAEGAGNRIEYKTDYNTSDKAAMTVKFDFKKEETASDYGAFDEEEDDDSGSGDGGALDFNPDENSEFKFVFNEDHVNKVEGDSLTLLGKKREVLDSKAPIQLGLDAKTPLKMKTGTKYKLVNAKERIRDKDGKIRIWDGFPGKGIFCLVEVDLDEEGEFMLAEDENDNLYAAKLNGKELCWNRIIVEEEKDDDNGQLKRQEDEHKTQKMEVKEVYDGYKMQTKQTFENGDMVLSFELYNGTQKVDVVGPIYLLKDGGSYVEVDKYAWDDNSVGRGRLLPEQMPVLDSGVRKFKNRETGHIRTDINTIPTDNNGKPLKGEELRKALTARHLY